MKEKNKEIYDLGFEETKSFKKTRVDEYLNIDETLIELEKSSSIIRLEMNSIELPLFSKDTKRVKNQIKVYNFKTDGSSFLKVEAPDGYSIPGEFEERVFIALTKIMKKNNYSRKFIVSANEILDNLNVTNPTYFNKIKTSIKLLAKTNYTFKNSLYSNIEKGTIGDEIHSNIMSIRILTRKDEEMQNSNYYDDGRIREIYQVSFTDYFYDNIVTKGYLAFDSEKLLAIENSVARSIYAMVEKWRGYDLYLRRPAFFIVRRIPLKWDKKNVRRTIGVIEKALNELKSENLIKTFKIIKESKWELAEIEVIFDEVHNKVKRDTFYEEKDNFKLDMFVTSTEEKIKEVYDDEVDDISQIINMFPEKVKLMKTFEIFLKEEIRKHGFDYVKFTSEYVIMKNPNKSIKSYLSQALDKNWADEYIAGKRIKQIKNKELPIKPLENEKVIETKNTYDYKNFEILTEEEKEKITSDVYNEFLKSSGSPDNKIMKGIFEKSKKALIINYLSINQPKVEKDFESPEIIEKTADTNAISNENIINKKYVSITQFVVEVSKICKKNSIQFDLENVVPVFKLFFEYEDEFIKINYDEEKNTGTLMFK